MRITVFVILTNLFIVEPNVVGSFAVHNDEMSCQWMAEKATTMERFEDAFTTCTRSYFSLDETSIADIQIINITIAMKKGTDVKLEEIACKVSERRHSGHYSVERCLMVNLSGWRLMWKILLVNRLYIAWFTVGVLLNAAIHMALMAKFRRSVLITVGLLLLLLAVKIQDWIE